MPPLVPGHAETPAPSRFLQQADAFCEKGILAAVVLVIIWGPLAMGGILARGFLGIQALTILALVLWMARIWIQRAFRLLWPPICWAVLVFLLYALVRCRHVPVEYAGRLELIQVMVYVSLFFVVVNNLQRRESPAIVTFVLMALGLALSLLAVYQFATKATHVFGMERPARFVGRGGATYYNPDHLAGLFGIILPLALSYTLLSRFKPIWKVLFAYAGAALLFGVGMTLSRGGILALGAMLVVFCLTLLFLRGYWLPATALGVVLIVAGIMFVQQFESLQKRFRDPVKNGQLNDLRVDYWYAAWHVFKDHPLWGGGPAQYDWEFARYRLPEVQTRPVYAHNDYLNTLSDWGAVGLGLIAVTLGLLGRGVFKTWPSPRPTELEAAPTLKSDKAAFLLGASMGLVYILFHSLVDFNMHIPANAAIVVILMALLSGHWRFVTERYWFDPGIAGKIGLTLVLAGAVGWLTLQGARRAHQTYWVDRATATGVSWNDQLDGFKKAYDAEPSDYAVAYDIGEIYRLAAQDARDGGADLVRQALPWYERGMKLNALDAYVPLRYGMCLDWLGRTNEASPYFNKAEEMDPNNVHIAYYLARHCVELGDTAAALHWFDHSIQVQYTDLAGWGKRMLLERLAETNGLYK